MKKDARREYAYDEYIVHQVGTQIFMKNNMMHSLKYSSKLSSSKRLWHKGSVFRKELYSVNSIRSHSDSKALQLHVTHSLDHSQLLLIPLTQNWNMCRHILTLEVLYLLSLAIQTLWSLMHILSGQRMRDRYGDFYTVGIPGTGSRTDSKGTLAACHFRPKRDDKSCTSRWILSEWHGTRSSGE